MIYFLLALMLFMGLHMFVARISDRGFSLELTFSRGMAAFFLVVLGFTALWLWWRKRRRRWATKSGTRLCSP